MIPSEKRTEASVSGRVCLAGENIDWISGPVLTAALETLRTSIVVSSLPGERVVIHYGNPSERLDQFLLNKTRNYGRESTDYIKAVLCTLSNMGYKVDGLYIDIKSSLPTSGGLASSGSFCVALVAAANVHYELNMDDYRIAEVAYIAEKEEMGIGCGQMDQYAVSLGGMLYLNCLTRPPEIQRLHSRDDVVLVIGDTGKSMRFSIVGLELRRRLEEKDPFLIQYVTKTEQAIQQARKLLTTSDWNPSDLGAILNQCHEYIRTYKQVLNPILENYIEAARNAGAYGAKSTGARSEGGCMFALCSREQSGEIAKAIAKCGGKTFVTPIAEVGIKSIKHG
jgi:galactokinase